MTSVADQDRAFRRYFWGIITILPGSIVAGLVARYFTIYATDVLLIAPAAVGTLLFVKRVFDGVTDPLFGWLSDRRKGARRLPFFRWGGVILFSVFGLFFPPPALEGLGLILWIGLFLILWELGQTMRNISVAALGLEVATDARRRTLLRTLFSVPILLGTLLGIGAMQYGMNAEDPQAALWRMLVPATIVWGITIAIASTLMMESSEPHRTDERPPWHMLREVLRNRYHRQYIAIELTETLAFTSLGFAIPYVMKYVFDRPDMTMYVLIIFLGAQTVATFGWLAYVKRVGVRRTWLTGKYIWMAILLAYPLAVMTGVYGFLALALFAGIGSGAGACVSYAILGDIADYDARESGRQRQGVYATLYGLIDKIGAGIGALALGWGLQMAGFVPNEAQSGTVLVAIGICVAALPAIGIAISIRLLHSYRFYEEQGVWDGREPTRDAFRQPLTAT